MNILRIIGGVICVFIIILTIGIPLVFHSKNKDKDV